VKAPHQPSEIVNVFREAYDVYVGSPSDGKDPREVPPGGYGFLGNPFTEGDQEEQIELFRDYFLKRIEEDRQFRLAVQAIRGRRLGCFCSPSTCHAQVIVSYLDARHLKTEA
jgi:hypothetical protein